MTLRVKELDIVKVIKDYLTGVQSSTELKGIDLIFTTQIESLRLFIDIEKMDKICMNLFFNALKFTERGGKIEIRIKDDTENCYLEIEDTGVGIPSTMLD